MRLSKAFIPIGALTLALSVGGSVARAAEREGHDRGGRQNQGHAQQRSNDQRGHEQRGVEERAQREDNNVRVQRENNNVRVQRENNFRAESNARVERRDDFNRRDDRAFRGYAVPRGRVEVIRPRVEVVRPRFQHHYGPSFNVFFGVGSGYRYGVPYYGRVYGYVPAPVYGARIYYGDVRLRVRPREAQVFVDGYYAGIVDDFDGVFQRLTLTVGPHDIEIEGPGLEPQVFHVMVDPARTIDVRADLYPDVQ
jgi:hypothetical protein